MSFNHVMATACTQTITLLYIYLYVWGLDLRLNNINYSYWYFPSSIIITSLYWTSETPLSSSITTSEYLICDIKPIKERGKILNQHLKVALTPRNLNKWPTNSPLHPPFLTLTLCCGNHLSQRQMITQMVNLLVGYQVGNSQENSTRSLC